MTIVVIDHKQDDLYTTAEDMSSIERHAAGEYDRQSGNCGLLGEDSNSYTYGTAQRSLETENHCHNMTNGMLPTQQDYPGSSSNNNNNILNLLTVCGVLTIIGGTTGSVCFVF